MFSPTHKDRAYDRDSHIEALGHVPTLTFTPPAVSSKLAPDHNRQDGSSHSDNFGSGSALPPPTAPPVPPRMSSPPLSPPLPPATIPSDVDWQHQHQQYQQHQAQVEQHQERWSGGSQHTSVTFPSPAHLSIAPRIATVHDHEHAISPGHPTRAHSEISMISEKGSAYGIDLEKGHQDIPTNTNTVLVDEDISTMDRKTIQRILFVRLVRFLFCIGTRPKQPEGDTKEKMFKKSDFAKGTVGDRIFPTLQSAMKEHKKYKREAERMNTILVVAIGLQVVLSALITALSAVTTGRSTSVMTSILGGAGTVVASYLAHAKGTDKLDTYQKRVIDLEKFIRECKAFLKDYGDVQMDSCEKTHGDHSGTQAGGQHGVLSKEELKIRMLDEHIHELRSHFEMLLGNFDSRRKGQPTSQQMSGEQSSFSMSSKMTTGHSVPWRN
ncbi:hypothetical protein SCHPADRAFT_940292 [Schizopora paradoxa]|uniref:SMODS and SLOG-associating 2TM effector domain-containing protein n=1 Tax=Schizopora paradoxa TaxID=27342 RepID=A0A0H2RNG9_9AGAM|nr:hypothetical protein SCHPADRAFT_940292 [Schizopora paradoxa]